MGEAVAYIVFGVVVAVGFLVTYFATKSSNKTNPICYSSRRTRDDSPPPTPPPSAFTSNLRKRCNSPERQSSSGATRKSTAKSCQKCGESPCVKISPCDHEYLCMGCISTHVETNDTCPQCKGGIDSCSPTIPSFGKCKSCGKFTKVQTIHPCGFHMSLCNKCFNEL